MQVLRFRANVVRRRLHGHEDRHAELRSLRQRLPCRPKLFEWSVHVWHWQDLVCRYLNLRDHLERSCKLRYMRKNL